MTSHQLLGINPRSLFLARLPVTHDTLTLDTVTVAGTIGRMTDARYITAAHRKQTGPNVSSRPGRLLSLYRNRHVDSLSFLRGGDNLKCRSTRRDKGKSQRHTSVTD